MALSIDFTNMMATAIPGGITEAEWAKAEGDFARAHGAFEKLRSGGGVGFVDIATDAGLLRQATSFAESARGKHDDVVVLGIGGSALGPIAMRTALLPPGWNSLDGPARKKFPRLHVLDNVDPATIASLLDRVPLERALWIVTSKSGGTAETMSQFLIVHGRYEQAKLPVKDHFVFVTDPAKGALRPLAARLGVPALDIPPNVGGRFSVLTPVGTLPAALVGIDVAAMVKGAAEMATRCAGAELAANPAGAYATLQWLSDTLDRKRVNVFMPYSDALRDMAAWFVQLWAESLGKTRPDGTFVGQTPLAALGATDQHSQVQLFMEGPADKTVTFLSVGDRGVDLVMPRAFQDVPDIAYLGGHSLGGLMGVEQRATAGALAKRGRPNLTIHLDRVDAAHIGQLMMLLELATAYAGQLYGIDAFDQPGVEMGKQFAYAMLGRAGFNAAKLDFDSLPKPDKRWRV